MKILSLSLLLVVAATLATSSTFADPLRKGPIHRYTFDGSGGDGARLADTAGNLHGKLVVRKGSSRLSGTGQLILDAGSWTAEAVFPPTIIQNRDQFSLEFWHTPTTTKYAWHIIYRLDNNQGKNGDYFWYALRNFETHRVEIADDGLNENIQAKVAGFQVGKTVHLVITYKALDPPASGFQVHWYAQGKKVAQKSFRKGLRNLEATRFLLGPTQGNYDEFRVYEYALSPSEIAANTQNGPAKLTIAPP